MTEHALTTRTPAQVAATGPETSGGVFGSAFDLQLWSSFPPDEMGAVIALVQGSALALADMVEKVIPVRHILAHRIDSVDEDTGEVKTLDRIVLVTPDGTAYASTSEGVRRSLSLLMTVYGKPPWSPPLRLKLTQVNTRKGRRTFVLSPSNVTE